MKKKFLPYFICWFLLLALFNVIVFVTPNEIAGVSKFSDGFWIGYGFTIAAFIGQLVCAYIAFGAKDIKKLLYNIPLINLSYITLAITVIVGIVFMSVPIIPAWIAAIICSIILTFGIISVIKAKAAADIVSSIDDNIASATSFIRELTARASTLLANVQTYEIEAEAKKVYEAVRYSDPMSSPKLNAIEKEIAVKFDNFEMEVLSGDAKIAKSLATELTGLINKRSALCKLYK